MQYYGKTETPYTMDYKPELVYQSKLEPMVWINQSYKNRS